MSWNSDKNRHENRRILAIFLQIFQKFGNFLAIFKQKLSVFLHPDGSHENGAKECIL